MNIFYLDQDPFAAARMHCDKHVLKMTIETVQMMVSAAKRQGVVDSELPLTKAGTFHKGGYRNHPCTLWVGNSRANYNYCLNLLYGLLSEFEARYDKEHFAATQVPILERLESVIPSGARTNPHQAIGEAYKRPDPVEAYRLSYKHEKSIHDWFSYDRGTPAPEFLTT